MNKEHATNFIYSTHTKTRATKFLKETFTKRGFLHLIKAWTELKSGKVLLWPFKQNKSKEFLGVSIKTTPHKIS
jgi:hypothetical protein